MKNRSHPIGYAGAAAVLVIHLVIAAPGARSQAAEGVGRASDAAAPLHSRLADLRRQSARLLQQKTAFEKALNSGQVDPFADLKDATAQFAPNLQSLRKSVERLSNPHIGKQERETLSKAVFAGLQPIGPWLDDATTVLANASLTPKQAAELDRLQNARDNAGWLTPSPGPDANNADADLAGQAPNAEDLTPVPVLSTLGADSFYTIHHLSVPLQIKTDPGAEVLWEAENGGEFENGLVLAQSLTDENGIARVTWVSRGGAAGPADVYVTTPGFPEPRYIQIHVVDLRFRTPPHLPAVLDKSAIGNR